MSGVVSSARGLLPVKRDLNATAHPKTGGTARPQNPKGYLEGCRASKGYSVQDPEGDKATVHGGGGGEGGKMCPPLCVTPKKSERQQRGLQPPPPMGERGTDATSSMFARPGEKQ